jgi:putative tryptophan/tyrosine transport system substrate-binding protein
VSSYRAQLRELGYVEGRNIRLEFGNAGGNVDQLSMLAENLVQAGDVDAIFAISTPAALAAHKATQTIPIVAFTAVDPVGSGLANSLARPGGNVTGIAVFSEETTVKRVELMRELAPRSVRLATVTTKVSKGAQGFGPVVEAGQKLGFAVENISVDDPCRSRKGTKPGIARRFRRLRVHLGRSAERAHG